MFCQLNQIIDFRLYLCPARWLFLATRYQKYNTDDIQEPNFTSPYVHIVLFILSSFKNINKTIKSLTSIIKDCTPQNIKLKEINQLKLKKNVTLGHILKKIEN